MDDDRFRVCLSWLGRGGLEEIQAVFEVLVGAVPFAKPDKLGAVPCNSNADANDLLFPVGVLVEVEDCDVFDKEAAGSSWMGGRSAVWELSRLDKDHAELARTCVTAPVECDTVQEDAVSAMASSFLAISSEGRSGSASEPTKL